VHHLNTLLDTIKQQVTCTGRYVNIRGYGYWQLLWTYSWVISVNGIINVWDVPVITDRTILTNWPDIVLHDKKEKTWLLIDGTIPVGSIFNIKENGKQSKYKYLEIELSRMWKEKTKFVPVIIGALGKIKKGLDQNLQLHPGHQSAVDLHKITLMTAATIIRKVLE